MKRRYHSNAENKRVVTVYKIIRPSKSLQIVPSDENQIRSLRSSIRYSSNFLTRNASIVSIVDPNIEKKIKSNSLPQLHEYPIENNDLEKNSNQIQKTIELDQIQQYDNVGTIQETIRPSVDPSSQNPSRNILQTQLIKKNDSKMSNVKMKKKRPVNNNCRKPQSKSRKKSVANRCCACSRCCVIASLMIGLLISIGIAALIVGLMNRSNARATATTTTVTTMTTSTTTTTRTTTTTSSTTSTASTTTTTRTTTSTSRTTSTTTSTATTTTRTTTSTSRTTSTTTSTATTTTPPILTIGANDSLYGLWNTVEGGNGILSTPGFSIGNYIAAEGPRNAFDKVFNNKYLSFGHCNNSADSNSLSCGVNTGFYLTLRQGPITINGIRFYTANDASERDPLTMTIEGSNQPNSTLLLGSSWTLIYNGSCGINTDPGRSSAGQRLSLSHNTVAYQSYRLLITSKRALAYAVQYAEVEFFGS